MSSLLNSTAVFGPVELPPEIVRQRVVDERTAAEFIGVSQVSLERMRKQGTAPRHVRLSERRLGYRVCDIIAWLEARASTDLPPAARAAPPTAAADERHRPGRGSGAKPVGDSGDEPADGTRPPGGRASRRGHRR